MSLHGGRRAARWHAATQAERATRHALFPVYRARVTRLYWNGLSLMTARHLGVLHCETEPLHDKRCPAS
jgi:hypothetical protein